MINPLEGVAGYLFEQLMSLDGFDFFENGWVTIIVEQILSTQPRIFFCC